MSGVNFNNTSNKALNQTDIATSVTGGDTTHVPSGDAVDVALDLKVDLSSVGAPSGVASLDGAGKVPLSQLPSSVFIYKGTWNATTNSPTLADGTGVAGWLYRVTVAGSQDLGSGTISFNVGDYVIYNTSNVWEKSDTTDAVTSVNGFSGTVTLVTDDIAEDGSPVNLWYTDARARTAIVTSSITNGDTTHSPDGNSVYDALQLKYDASNPSSYIDAAGAVTAVVVQTITNGDTGHASSSDALFDALALKYDASNPSSYVDAAGVRSVVLTGLSSADGAIVATDTILQGFNKTAHSLLRTDANSNVFGGTGAGSGLSAGANSVIIGNNAGTADVSTAVLVGGDAGKIMTAVNSVAIGYQSLDGAVGGAGNTTVGYRSMRAATGGTNTGVGYQAANANTSGTGNVAIGASALEANTTSSQSTAVGTQSLQVNTAQLMTAVGYLSLAANTTGTASTAIGANSLRQQTTGASNVGVGNFALRQNVTGTQNVGIGNAAGGGVSGNSYSNNAFVGFQAGQSVTTGSQNVIVGSTGTMGTTAQDVIGIGYAVTASANNAIAIGSGASATGADSLAIGKSVSTSTANEYKIGTSSTTYAFPGTSAVYTGTLSASNLSGTNTGDVTLGAVGSTPNANAASLSGQVVTLQPADGSFPGVVTTGSQTFNGAKTFGNTIIGATNTQVLKAGDTMTGILNIENATDATGLVVKGSLGQTNDLAQFNTNDNVAKFRVEIDGTMTGSAYLQTPNFITRPIPWAIANNQSTPEDIVDLSFDGSITQYARWDYIAYRESSDFGASKWEAGYMEMFYDTYDDSWVLVRTVTNNKWVLSYTGAGVLFDLTISGSVATVNYSSDDIGATDYVGEFRATNLTTIDRVS